MTDRPHFRAGRRQPVTLKVRYRRDDADATLEQVGKTNDLGIGGAFIQSHKTPPVGSQIVLVVSSPTAWEPLSLPAEVRWINDGSDGQPRGFGVRFRVLSSAEATALYQLIHACEYAEPTE
jgi:hypothetical protein